MARLVNRPRVASRKKAAPDGLSTDGSPRNSFQGDTPEQQLQPDVPNSHHRHYPNHQRHVLFSRHNMTILMIGMMLGYIVLPFFMVQQIAVDDLATRMHKKRPEFSSWKIDNKEARNSNVNYIAETSSISSNSGGGILRGIGEVQENGALSYASSSRIMSANVAANPSPKDITTNAAVSRLRENFDLLATQSIPTFVQPDIFYTPKLSDKERMKILVTGGAGFVGSHLVDKLMTKGHEVIVVDNFFTGQKRNIEHWLHHPYFSLVTHDVIEPIMLEVDQIYHLACPASPPHYQYNPVKTIKTSTMGTINMLGLAKRVKARILLTSTSEIYGDPKEHPQKETYWGNVNTIGPRSCYDEGKRVAETMMYSYRDQADVVVRVARIFNTFGPRMHPNDGRVVSNFIIQALQNKPLTIYGDGSTTRSFQYVSDLVDGLYKLMNGEYDMPVNLGNPDEYKISDFAKYIKDITNSESQIKKLPEQKDDPSQRRPDITVAKTKINWEPRVLVRDGLEHTIKFFQQILDETGEINPTGPGPAKPEA